MENLGTKVKVGLCKTSSGNLKQFYGSLNGVRISKRFGYVLHEFSQKSKLVTLCSTNSGLKSNRPLFTYEGESRSDKTGVKVTLPEDPENVVYCEHYDSPNDTACRRLSFIFVGAGSNNGETPHQFHVYKDVHTVDFSRKFISVKSLFQITSQLRRCVRVRFYLDSANIPCSQIDDALYQLGNASQFIASNVRILHIDRHGVIDPCVWERSRTRLDHILEYARKCFPNLETVTIKMECVIGRIYDLILGFCKDKQNERLTKHNVTLKDGIITCEPVVEQRSLKYTPQRVMNGLSPDHLKDTQKLHDAKSVEYTQKFPKPIMQLSSSVTKNGFSQQVSEPTVKEGQICSSPTPTIVIMKGVKDEVELLPRTPKVIPMIDIVSDSDDETIPCTSSKQAKVCTSLKNMDIKRNTHGQFGKSLGSLGRIGAAYGVITSEAGENWVTPTPPKRFANSLKGIGAAYDDWELSSITDDEAPLPLPVQSKAEIPDEIINSVDETMLKNILKQASKTEEQSTSSSSDQRVGVVIKGINYERPSRKYESGSSRKRRQ